MIAAFVVALLVVLSMLAASRLLRVRTTVDATPYECGEVPTGTAWRSAPLGFLAFAFVFVLFDVELAFVVPWVTAEATARALARPAVLVFLVTLLLGWVHAWRRGDLAWRR